LDEGVFFLFGYFSIQPQRYLGKYKYSNMWRGRVVSERMGGEYFVLPCKTGNLEAQAFGFAPHRGGAKARA
jgi:hypothetical protein